MRGVVFRLPADTEADAVMSEIGNLLRLRVEPTVAVRRVHLDTFDWRLWHAGGQLVFEQAHGHGWLLWSGDEESGSCVMPAAEPPRRGADLPDSLAGRRIAALIEPRALLALGMSSLQRRSSTVVDARDKSVARLTLEETVNLDADDRPAGSPIAYLRLDGLTGFESEYARVKKVLRSELGLEPAADDDLARAAGLRGRTPGDYSSKVAIPLVPDEPAEGAVRQILGALLHTVVVNTPGASRDLDSEFLHDLRVAVRRARSLLGQLKRTMPTELRERFGAELRWLGSVTGPTRDLDVYLIELNALIAEAGLADPAVLAPFLELLRQRREQARHAMVEALGGDRFNRLVDDLRGAIAEPISATQAPHGSLPVAEVARTRIRRALDRVVRRGAVLGPGSPLSAFHRLRIDAKNLRYLLELFADLLPAESAATQVKALKQLQDVLGGLQDVAVQRTRLAGFAEELAADGSGPAATLLAMGRLTVALDAREASNRAAFHDRFARFACAGGRAGWDELLDTERTR